MEQKCDKRRHNVADSTTRQCGEAREGERWGQSASRWLAASVAVRSSISVPVARECEKSTARAARRRASRLRLGAARRRTVQGRVGRLGVLADSRLGRHGDSANPGPGPATCATAEPAVAESTAAGTKGACSAAPPPPMSPRHFPARPAHSADGTVSGRQRACAAAAERASSPAAYRIRAAGKASEQASTVAALHLRPGGPRLTAGGGSRLVMH